MLSYRSSLNHMHKTCIAFQDNLYKYKRKILSHGHLHPKLLQGQMEGVGGQDTSELLLRACTEIFQEDSKRSQLSFFHNKLAVSKLSQILQQEGNETSHCWKVQALMT